MLSSPMRTALRRLPRSVTCATPLSRGFASPAAMTGVQSSRLEFQPLSLPPTADASKFGRFGRKVVGFSPGDVTVEETDQIKKALYDHGVLIFEDLILTPKQQYELTRSFDPQVQTYGHGTTKPSDQKKSILHPDLKTIPHQPQVQLIGNGPVSSHEGLSNVQLKHPHHKTFHKTVISDQEEAEGKTRFYRWHIDAALYDLAPPRVTSLYAVKVPRGERQVIKYDDGTGDELDVPLGTTAFVSGATMFDILPSPLKSLAVRTSVKYAPHPYVWMARAKAKSTGLGIEDDGLELGMGDLPEWKEEKVKVLPMCWKNPENGALHVQAHPCGAMALYVDPLPEGVPREGAMFPDGAVIDDLKEVRALLYKIQRPGIAPELVYPVDWKDNDLALFHNQVVLHSVVGAFAPDQVRMFHQCNLAASEDPLGPDEGDLKAYA